MKKWSISVVMLLLAGPVAPEHATQRDDVVAVRRTVERHYLAVVYGDRPLEELPPGFHPEFQMLVLTNGTIDRRGLKVWMDRLAPNLAKRRQMSPPPTYAWEMPIVDVTRDAAAVKIEIFENGKPAATDYLTLYRFADGWKIVTKVFAAP